MASDVRSLPVAPATSAAGWLYGRWTDLLLGAGLGYALSIPLLALLADASGWSAWPLVAVITFSLFVSGPHYGATILRVYEHREDRRRYALFAVWITLALCGLFVAGLHDALLGSILITLYGTWSPWHFSGQNYGVALMFMRRRGVAVDPRAKRLLYASFLLSFALWILVMHGAGYSVTVATVSQSAASSYRFLPLGIPLAWVEWLAPVLALAWALSLAGVVALLLRGASLRDLLPSLVVLALQALWYVVPALALRAHAPLNGLAFAVIWISAAHAAQYLWVTSYYAKREDPAHRLGPYLGRALLAGSTVTILPGLLFAPGLLGNLPWDLGLGILLVSVVNLHHFVLDGAIWKLRDGRVARFLLRETPVEPGLAPAGGSRFGFRAGVALLGIVSLAIAGIDFRQRLAVEAAGADAAGLLRASEWLRWIGRDSPELHALAGQRLAQQGDSDAAEGEFRRSLALHPTSRAWIGLGHVQAERQRWSEASEAYAAALDQDPDDPIALVGAGRAWLQLGRPDLALAPLRRARLLAPDNPAVVRLLRLAREG